MDRKTNITVKNSSSAFVINEKVRFSATLYGLTLTICTHIYRLEYIYERRVYVATAQLVTICTHIYRLEFEVAN